MAAVPPFGNVRIHFLFRFLVAQQATQVAHSAGGRWIDDESIPPAEVTRIESVVQREFLEMLGQTARAVEIHRVHIGSGRKVKRIIRSAVDHRHGSVGHWSVQLLRDVIRAQRVLETQIESVILTKKAVAVGSLWTLVTAVPAESVNIHRNEKREVADQRFAPAVRLAIGNHPGHCSVLQFKIDLKRKRRPSLLGDWAVRSGEIHTGWRRIEALDSTVRMDVDYIRVATVSHRPVEVIFEHRAP